MSIQLPRHVRTMLLISMALLSATVASTIITTSVLRGPVLTDVLQSVEDPSTDDVEAAEASLVLYARGVSALPSTTTLYNQGLLHHQASRVPAAIACWRAAQALSPRHPDIAHNLALARQQLDSSVPPPAAVTPSWRALLTPMELGLLTWISWFVTLLLQGRTSRSEPVWRSTLVSGILSVGLTCSLAHGVWASQQVRAAVLTEQAPARAAPTFDASTTFEMPPGTEVLSRELHGRFVLVEDGLGRKGWVASSVLAQPDGAPQD